MGNANTTPTVYLVHPDPAKRERLRVFMTQEDFVVRDFSSTETFLEAYDTGWPACLVVDLQRGVANGLVARLRNAGVTIPTILIAARGSVRDAVQAMRSGADSIIEKPYARAVLVREIRSLLDRNRG